jgi:hypothetical protein
MLAILLRYVTPRTIGSLDRCRARSLYSEALSAISVIILLQDRDLLVRHDNSIPGHVLISLPISAVD